MVKNLHFLFLLILLLICFSLTGCSSKTLTRSNLAFDTVVSVTIYGTENEDILTKVFDTIRNYDDQLNAFTDNSVISSINRESTVVDQEIFELLEKNLEVAQLSNGQFNPLMGRLISLWDINEPIIKETPDPEEIQELLKHISIENLKLDQQTSEVSIIDSEAELNLGASVKGFVADRVKEQLLSEGINSALINLGGNILLIGDKKGEDFQIGIDDPNIDSEEPLGSLELSDKSIVTSGNYQRYFMDEEGNLYHHILDPRTGYPVKNELKEVVVVADTSLEADILSTTFFVLGKDESIEYLKRNYSEENKPSVIFVTENTIFIDKGLKENFTLNSLYQEQYRVEEFTAY